MNEQILALIILLIGLGVMIGGTKFIDRIFSVVSGCIQAVIGAIILVLLSLLALQIACNAAFGG